MPRITNRRRCMEDFSFSFSDDQMMDLALRLGRRCAGATAENPAVGCVITAASGGRTTIVGRGWTQQGGRPHAERVALAEAGDLARGATAYVTLEPCSHHGKSPPCAEALIEAGIARVVCAHADPDRRVAGRGFEMLRKAGIAVETGLLEARAHRHLSGFLSRTVRGRPWLQAKMAFSPDGMIGKIGVGNYPVTGPEAKARTYGLRMKADAILVGADTVLFDDPTLTVRLPGLEASSPVRVVLDGRGRVPLDAQLVKSAAAVPTWVVTAISAPEDWCNEMEARGCTVLRVKATAAGHVDLLAAFEALAARGINTIFAECGAALSRALLEGGLIDEFFLYRSTTPIGADGLVALSGEPEAALASAGFKFETSHRLGQDTLKTFIRSASLKSLYGG
ncbi:bifunctional diaminohydroxyphosphoribosylaminopyrimidine deaminase/5-amino-6-(5-phosphoribosylamino)uracil reductase RibD [uncultured Cohaesibacter sp.]|uniref:bifunctional diaminohydroxyphosphoribosylaminopyrimidine deaminase/5-amino-6-(5-phosphoribosylamino)uracil reductase RibD n=1 Tax=uncultured Cohaesibacter sp. TaxID=1002546 RepID=UPI0029C70D0F|nr:bifunctional diaminohydroxyphosphoribosylaminopyrimidine deaminase/5-amino-6-(5-phosphoribosylamino)uracil reductase RibD [uncultured Cohaesibacter sp.]